MKVITTKIESKEESSARLTYYYDQYINPMAWTLENYMLKNNIFMIGTTEKAEKFAENDKLLGIDMSLEDRCFRSFLIKDSFITLDQLNKWHKLEEKRWQFYYFSQIKNRINLDYIFPKLNYGDEFFSIMKKFNYKHRPQFKKFKEMSIPPYFIYDLEFDGMEYHHRLDENILNSAEFIELSELSLNRKDNSEFKPKNKRSGIRP